MKLKYVEPLSYFAFNFNLRRYVRNIANTGVVDWAGEVYALWEGGRGLHSSTFQLNFSAFRGIGGAFRGH